MSAVATYSYTHSVTYVTDNILKSLKDIIVLSGLNPATFVNDWESNKRAMKAWLNSGHLTKVVLEVYDPSNDRLIIRWDIEIIYSWQSTGDGSFWTDTDQLRYAIKKAGVVPSLAKYELILQNKEGRPDVEGWSRGCYRSTEGMAKQSLGTTIEHSGLGGQTGYWRRT